MEVHELMDPHGVPQRNHGSPWKSTICGCPRDSMEVHGGVIWCVKCRLSLHRAGSNLCHSACKVSDVKGTEWGRIGAKRRKRLGAASTYPRWIDMPSLKSLLFGNDAFQDCSRVVFESEWLEERMMTRLAWIDFYSTWFWRIHFQSSWWFKWINNAKWWWWNELMNRLA